MTAERTTSGGFVDRGEPRAFAFDGRRLVGFAGDTVASALLANDVAIVGRSFKLHRPRGVVACGYDDPGSMLTRLAPQPAANLLATVTDLEGGATYQSVNAWPSAERDVGAIAQAFARLLPAGFYYKTFMLPTWHAFEPFVRRAAGLGRLPADPWRPVSESRFGHCDVLVAGAGPAGLAAALTAGRAGVRTWLVDDGLRPGGRLLDDGPAAAEAIAPTIAELDSLPNVRRFARSTVWGHHERGFVTVLERRPADAPDLDFRHWKLRCAEIVVATGAFERALAFADNDRPFVMLAGAARAYLGRYGVRAGANVVVATNNDSGHAAALALLAAGAEVLALDSREQPPREVEDAVTAAGGRVLRGARPRRALGRRRVEGVEIATGDGRVESRACDLVAVSGGWNPAFHLVSHARGVRSTWSEELSTFVAASDAAGMRLAGAARGTFTTGACADEGAAAALASLAALGRTGEAARLPASLDDGFGASGARSAWSVPDRRLAKKTFVDLAGDVTVADLGLALREGYDSIELVKRYTTAGMGVDQGKIGNVDVIGTVAAHEGRRPEEVGTTTFRPPFVPIEFGAIAGARQGARLYPWRHTPLAEWHLANGAVMYEAGLRWQRPGFYPRDGEDWKAAAAREARAVREAVGVYDGTPLGRFRIKGLDAPALLDFVYVGDVGRLAVGRGRYSVMLTDDGLVLDDGVTFRIGPDRWLLHASTGAADRVHAHLEQVLQVHRPDWRVTLTPLASQWANATLCGPRARDVLAALRPDFDVSRAALPFMGMAEGALDGLPVQVFRVSWTGEASFEIVTPARHAVALWERIMAAGAPFGIVPVGSEANHILRVEAGYISTGHEVDGTADVFDLGLGALVSKAKADFLGKRSMELRRRSDPARHELVGLLPVDPQRFVPEGAPLTPNGAPADQEGFVSACVESVACGRVVALGLLREGRARMGQTVHARIREEIAPMTVAPPVFHDRDRTRVKS